MACCIGVGAEGYCGKYKLNMTMSASPKDNLQTWLRGPDPYTWVVWRDGHWNHEDWTCLLDHLRVSQYWPMDANAVGQAVEEIKASYLQRKSHHGKCAPQDLLEPHHHISDWTTYGPCPHCGAPLAYWDRDSRRGGVDYLIEFEVRCVNPVCGKHEETGEFTERGPF